MIKRILVGSPIRQAPAILKAFLRSLSELSTDGLELSFFFIDDNKAAESSDQLLRFQETHARCAVHRDAHDDEYICDSTTHHWNERLVWKVAAFKERIIAEARRQAFDFLFLVDSDLVLPPQLVAHLASLQKPVVSEVFWTSWQPDIQMLPQVWLGDNYNLFARRPGEMPSEQETAARQIRFLKQLRRVGTLPVGGLGACTLISREALDQGVSFAEIDNVSFPGEDRHFCIRARVLGVELCADTRFPPLHLYRLEDLSRLDHYRARFAANFLERPKLTLSMIVRDEAGRWLREALRAHRPFIDEAVIVDDGSTDRTVEVVEEELEGLPVWLVRNGASRFSNEVDLRRQQWDESIASNPDWLLILDADDILESRAASIIPELIHQTDHAVFGFELYDFWTATEYRDDRWWRAHRTPRPFLTRYTPDFRYEWNETPQHCGRMPNNVAELNTAAVNLRVKHMGWATESERIRKHERYQALDPDARFGIREQYDSILDHDPHLVAWCD